MWLFLNSFIWVCQNKEKILKTRKINRRSVSVIYDCFQTVIYGRFETANIWLNKTGCVLLEAYMDVPKRLHMSVSTLPYFDVPTHLHTFVLERRGRSETLSDNCFYTPRIWPRHISVCGKCWCRLKLNLYALQWGYGLKNCVRRGDLMGTWLQYMQDMKR